MKEKISLLHSVQFQWIFFTEDVTNSVQVIVKIDIVEVFLYNLPHSHFIYSALDDKGLQNNNTAKVNVCQ